MAKTPPKRPSGASDVQARELADKTWYTARSAWMAAESALFIAHLARNAAEGAMNNPDDFTAAYDARLFSVQAAESAKEASEAASESSRARHLLSLLSTEHLDEVAEQIGEARRVAARIQIRLDKRLDKLVVPPHLLTPEIEALRPPNRRVPTLGDLPQRSVNSHG